MAFLTRDQLQRMSFRRRGRNVLVSDKASIYNADQIEIGDHSRIDDFCVISGKVTLGRNVHIAVYCNVAGGTEGVTLEDFSGLAYGCHVFTQSDDYTGATLTNPTVPSKYKNEAKAPVHIGRHCIVGTNSCGLLFPPYPRHAAAAGADARHPAVRTHPAAGRLHRPDRRRVDVGQRLHRQSRCDEPDDLFQKGKIGEYNLMFGEDVDIFGLSLSKQVGSLSLGAELSYRKDMPLLSEAPFVLTPGTIVFLEARNLLPAGAVSTEDVPESGTIGAVGDTMHGLDNLLGIVSDTPLWDTASWSSELTWAFRMEW